LDFEVTQIDIATRKYKVQSSQE